MFIFIGISPIVVIILGVVMILNAHITAGILLAMLGIMVAGVISAMGIAYLIARINRLPAPTRYQLSRAEAFGAFGDPQRIQPLPRAYDERSVGTVSHGIPQLEGGHWEYRSALDGLTREERIEAAAKYLAAKYGDESSAAYEASPPFDDDRR